MSDEQAILHLPYEDAIAAVRAKGPEFWAQFTDQQIIMIINDLREMEVA